MTSLSAALKEFREEITAIRICCNLDGEPNCAECGKQMDELVATFAENLLREAREETFEKLVSCMPSSAENLSNITPEDAKKTITAFLRVPYTCDQKDMSVVMEKVGEQINGAVRRLD